MADRPIEGVTYRPRVDSRVARRVLAVRQCYRTHSPWWSVEYLEEGSIILKYAGEKTWLGWMKETLAQPTHGPDGRTADEAAAEPGRL
jgi:hypothetical protein